LKLGSKWANIYFDTVSMKIKIIDSDYTHVGQISQMNDFSRVICKRLGITYRTFNYDTIDKKDVPKK